MKSRIIKVIGSVFGSNSSITEDFSQDSQESWDSIKHMNLIVALEEEFDIEFSEDEISDMYNFKIIYIIIKEKLGKSL